MDLGWISYQSFDDTGLHKHKVYQINNIKVRDIQEKVGDKIGSSVSYDSENRIVLFTIKGAGSAGKVYVTTEQLEKMGWSNATGEMTRNLNNILEKYHITTTERIRHFLAQCAHETKWASYGDALTEKYGGDSAYDYFEGKYGYKTKTGKGLGNLYEGDGSLFRGTGYIHLTGRYNYQKFADYIKDASIMKEGYKRIASIYAWEVAGWFWDTHNINNLIGNTYSVSTVSNVRDIINPNEKYSDFGATALESRIEAYKKASQVIN